MTELTWEEVKASKQGEVFVDEFDEGLRFRVVRGPGSLCAYIGIPKDHPMAGKDYNDLPINAHGGLTFSSPGKPGTPFLEDFYWYGWDYAHLGDRSFYDFRFEPDEIAWTPKMVKDDSWETIYEFKKLMKLMESK